MNAPPESQFVQVALAHALQDAIPAHWRGVAILDCERLTDVATGDISIKVRMHHPNDGDTARPTSPADMLALNGGCLALLRVHDALGRSLSGFRLTLTGDRFELTVFGAAGGPPPQSGRRLS